MRIFILPFLTLALVGTGCGAAVTEGSGATDATIDTSWVDDQRAAQAQQAADAQRAQAEIDATNATIQQDAADVQAHYDAANAAQVQEEAQNAAITQAAIDAIPYRPD